MFPIASGLRMASWYLNIAMPKGFDAIGLPVSSSIGNLSFIFAINRGNFSTSDSSNEYLYVVNPYILV